MTRRLSVQLTGDLADTTAEALGCVVRRGDRVWLEADYVDQAQLTGLLVRLGDLNLGFERVEIVERAVPVDGDHDDAASQQGEGQ